MTLGWIFASPVQATPATGSWQFPKFGSNGDWALIPGTPDLTAGVVAVQVAQEAYYTRKISVWLVCANGTRGPQVDFPEYERNTKTVEAPCSTTVGMYLDAVQPPNGYTNRWQGSDPATPQPTATVTPTQSPAPSASGSSSPSASPSSPSAGGSSSPSDSSSPGSSPSGSGGVSPSSSPSSSSPGSSTPDGSSGGGVSGGGLPSEQWAQVELGLGLLVFFSAMGVSQGWRLRG